MNHRVWLLVPILVGLLGAGVQAPVRTADLRADSDRPKIATADLVWRENTSNVYFTAADADLKAQEELVTQQFKSGAINSKEYQELLLRIRQSRKSNLQMMARPNSGTAAQFADYRLNGRTAAGSESAFANAKFGTDKSGKLVVDSATFRVSVGQQVSALRASVASDPEQAPMVAYLDAIQNRADSQLKQAGPAIDFGKASAIYQPVRYAASLLDSSGNLMELSVRSVPSGATVVIFSQGTYRREVTSDTKMRIVRGWFSYSVSKAGFKLIERNDLDLVTASANAELVCNLVPSRAKQGAQACNLQ